MLDARLDAILAAPDADAPRLAWAQREGGERGELVAIQCRLARSDVPRDERRGLVAREREILRAHERTWLSAAGLAHGSFERGFVSRAEIPLDDFADRAAEICARSPLLRHIALRNTTGTVNGHVGPQPSEAWAEIAAKITRGLHALPAGRLRGFSATASIFTAGDWADVGGASHFGDDLARLVADAPTVSNLASLTVLDGEIGRAAVPHLKRLRSLESLVASHKLGGAGCVELLGAMPDLRRFGPRAGNPPIRRGELATLLASPEIARLTELDLAHNELDGEDLACLARTPSLARLELLGLAFARVSPAALGALGASPHLAGLAELRLTGAAVTDEGLEALAAARFAPTLRVLALDYALLTTRAVPTLLSFPRLERLEIAQVHGLAPRLAALEAVVPRVRA